MGSQKLQLTARAGSRGSRLHSSKGRSKLTQWKVKLNETNVLNNSTEQRAPPMTIWTALVFVLLYPCFRMSRASPFSSTWSHVPLGLSPSYGGHFVNRVINTITEVPVFGLL